MIHHFRSLAHVIYSYGILMMLSIQTSVCFLFVWEWILKYKMHFVIVILQWKV
uniref:Uncharacterized protein n=1 Tax=Anguilla anguilla TaxID=7936 RepID=A0A0E9VWM5_ANGAN